MQLMTQDLRRKLPPLYDTEHLPEAVAHVKYFTPWANWAWYAVQFDGEDIFLGYIHGPSIREWSCFSLSQLEGLRGPCGQRVERDMCFQPCQIAGFQPMTGQSETTRSGRHE